MVDCRMNNNNAAAAADDVDAVYDSDSAVFADDFKEYMHTELCWQKHILPNLPWRASDWVFWSRDDDDEPCALPYDNWDLTPKTETATAASSPKFLDTIRSAFGHIFPNIYVGKYPLLVQFWAHKTMGGRSLLTSKNQPFALRSFDEGLDIKGLCSYRKFSKESEFYVDSASEEGLGLYGRVFLHQWPESTPNVEYYSIKEYPQRDHALCCQIRSSLAFPVFEPSGQCCVGVFELVSTTRYAYLTPVARGLACAFKEVGLKCVDVPPHSRLHSTYTGDDVYILEFFLPMSYKTGGDPHISLSKILGTMKKFFKTFKLASGEELTEKLSIEVIDFQDGEKHDSVQISQTTRYTTTPLPQSLQNGGGQTMLLDSSDLLSVDAINNGSNVLSSEQSNIDVTRSEQRNIDVTRSQENGTIKVPKGEYGKTGVKFEIPLEDIQQNSKLSLKAAAKNLEVSRSTLKRVCREYGIPRWPPRKMKNVSRAQSCESLPYHKQIPQLNSDLPSNQVSAAVVNTKPHNKMLQDANTVTVRAKYVNDVTIKFRLSSSSSLVELQQQVAKRLNLEAGTYNIKYDEDGESILIACDEDLQDYINASISLGSTSMVVLLEPKLPTSIDQLKFC